MPSMEHDGGNGNVSSPSPTPTMCTTGCGFYGNSAFDGMCSKCFKDALKRRQQSTSPATHVQAAQQQHESACMITNVRLSMKLSTEALLHIELIHVMSTRNRKYKQSLQVVK